MPKFLFKNEFENLSTNARQLYMLLRDRFFLSVKNKAKFTTKEGKVYVVFLREEMEKVLGLCRNSVLKIIKELKSLNLISEKRQGLNKPNLIFVNAVSVPADEPEQAEPKKEEPQKTVIDDKFAEIENKKHLDKKVTAFFKVAMLRNLSKFENLSADKIAECIERYQNLGKEPFKPFAYVVKMLTNALDEPTVEHKKETSYDLNFFHKLNIFSLDDEDEAVEIDYSKFFANC